MVLLPGLDGTGELFQWFVEAAPSDFRCTVAAYPPDVAQTYADYAALVLDEYVPNEAFLIVSESFSGPVAVLAAAQRPEGLAGVVLCNTFVTPPAWTGLRRLPWSYHLRRPVPKTAAGFFLVGFRRVSEFVGPIRRANLGVDPTVLASRMEAVFSVDVRTELAGLEVPTMYLRGTRDRLVRPRSMRQVKSTRPDTQVGEIDGPHLLLQTDPDESWRVIGEFGAVQNLT